MSEKNKTVKGIFSDPKNRSRLYWSLFFLAFLTLFIINNSASEPEAGPYPPNYTPAGENGVKPAAPGFTLPAVDGSELKLSDYSGKVVLIDFWATWCPPCRKSIPDLISLKKEYGSKGFEVIAISLDSDDPRMNTKKDVPSFVKQYGLNYPVVYGNQSVVSAYGNITSIPTSFLIGKDGKIISKHIGLVDKAVYVSEIEAALKK